MDIDQFLSQNSGTWDQLRRLLTKAERTPRQMSGDELAELIALHRSVSGHLSIANTNFENLKLRGDLSRLVARSNAFIYSARPRTLRTFGRFFSDTVPAALAGVRPFLLVSAALTFVPAIAIGVLIVVSPHPLNSIPVSTQNQYVQQDFASYYRVLPSAEFASHVYWNNVTVAIEAFVAGLFLCVPAAYLLFTNGANLGIAAGLFYHAHKAGEFWGLILPHGMIELTSVVIAGAAGLKIGWTFIAPGDRTRSAAMISEGRRLITLIFCTFFTLLVAATIEGFITGSSLPTFVRVGIGVLVEGSFLSYATIFGHRARMLGLTGDMDEVEYGWSPQPA